MTYYCRIIGYLDTQTFHHQLVAQHCATSWWWYLCMLHRRCTSSNIWVSWISINVSAARITASWPIGLPVLSNCLVSRLIQRNGTLKRVNSYYFIINQQDAAVRSQFYFTAGSLRVSGAFHTHHQEYIKLYLRPPVQTPIISSTLNCIYSLRYRYLYRRLQIQFNVLLMMGLESTRNM